jgi:hypothetical protein
MMRAITALAGVVLVAVPVAAGPRGIYPVAALGLLCALLTGWPQRGTAVARRAVVAVRARTGISARGGGPARAQIAPAGRGPAPVSTGGAAAGGERGMAEPGAAGPGAAGPDPAERVRTAAGTLAAVAVIIECAASRLDTAALAGEGLLLLGFLLLLGRPAGLAGGTVVTWLRLRLPAVLGAVAATGIVLAALAAVPGSSPWLALGGLAAAVAAYLVAAPWDGSGSRRG